MPIPRPKDRLLWLRSTCALRAVRIVVVCLWVAGAVTGLGVLASYAARPAPGEPSPLRWPSSTALRLHSTLPTVVVFVHPHCPCSAATLTELARLLARAPACSVTIAFYAPSSLAADWGKTPLRRQAEALEGVIVLDDTDASGAKLFGAAASGQVVVYGPAGELRFGGGITASRGHEGDNLGADCVRAALRGETPAAFTTPVYGCEIVSRGVTHCPECEGEDRRDTAPRN